MLVNGKPADFISAKDRGLSYGDGVFRTLRIQQGSPFCWQRHYEKLRHDCTALNIECPDAAVLQQELEQISAGQSGVAKIIVTRGVGARGYAPSTATEPTRIVSFQPETPADQAAVESGVELHLCQIRLARQPCLAGIKHLNRLENVIAAAECEAAGRGEGLLQDENGHVISGTRSNLFAVQQGKLFTPDLAASGVAGVQRDRVIAWAQQNGVDCSVAQLTLPELMQADELFLVNSVFGLWPVARLKDKVYAQRAYSQAIQSWLNDEAQN